MNIYKRKLRWKSALLLSAVLIGIGSLYYTNQLVKNLSNEERKKVELWAEATTRIIDSGNEDENFSFLLKVIQNNTTVPVIVLDTAQNIVMSRNLDSAKVNNPKFVQRRLKEMRANYDPITITLPNKNFQYIYYDKSTTLRKLTYYPYAQLGIILLFILVAYLAFSNSRTAEQNQVWIGLSKETAHQLGTPISSLMAWYEVLKTKIADPVLIEELNKDISRLSKIVERFSKVGSRPKLDYIDISLVIEQSISYIRTRTSDKIHIEFKKPSYPIIIPLNASLFEWVIENLCKNAIDAMAGNGALNIEIRDNTQIVYIDVSDEGKGIPVSKYRSIFKPGYTTKDNGWGLGLSLAKRIVEEYHDGKIFVHSSEQDRGTKMRMVFNKSK